MNNHSILDASRCVKVFDTTATGAYSESCQEWKWLPVKLLQNGHSGTVKTWDRLALCAIVSDVFSKFGIESGDSKQ